MDRKPNKIEVTVFDDENQLIGLIDFIRKAAAPGHSFIVVVDPDMPKKMVVTERSQWMEMEHFTLKM